MELRSPTIDDLALMLREQGRTVRSRLGDTLEVIGVSCAWPLGARPHRHGMAPLLTDVEASMVLLGSWRPSALRLWCPSVPLDMFEPWAQYGPLVGAQLPRAVRRLQRDPSTRRAVVSLVRTSGIPPCNCLLQFLLRDGRLHVHAYARSIDLKLGLPYDVGTWSVVGSVVASTINAARGDLVLHIGSLHHYLYASFPSGNTLDVLGEVTGLEAARKLADIFLLGGDRWLTWHQEPAQGSSRLPSRL